MGINPRIILVLDGMTDEQAFSLLAQLSPELCRVKVGKELFTRFGPDFIRKIQALGFEVFLDLKFHDIPKTVELACKAAAELGVWMINVHASGGPVMLQAAREGISFLGQNRPLLIAVTLLTSMTEHDLRAIGVNESPEDWVLRLARLTHQAGLDGVVCSAQEATRLRQSLPANFCLVTPGIRLPDAKVDDQQRIMTPTAAIQAGSDYLVIGRPITQANHPRQVLESIIESISHSIRV